MDSPEPSVADPQSLIISEAIRHSVMGLAGSMADILSKNFEQFSGQLTDITHALTSQVGKSPSHNESSCNQAIVTSPEKRRGKKRAHSLRGEQLQEGQHSDGALSDEVSIHAPSEDELEDTLCLLRKQADPLIDTSEDILNIQQDLVQKEALTGPPICEEVSKFVHQIWENTLKPESLTSRLEKELRPSKVPIKVRTVNKEIFGIKKKISHIRSGE